MTETAPKNVLGAAALPLRRYARFRGRSSRLEFWSYTVAVNVLQLALMIIATPLAWPVSLALLVPSQAVLVRRLHDVDRSGWWAVPLPLLGFSLFFLYASTSVMLGDETGRQILIAAALNVLALAVLGGTLLAWTCRRGTSGPNRFGLPE